MKQVQLILKAESGVKALPKITLRRTAPAPESVRPLARYSAGVKERRLAPLLAALSGLPVCFAVREETSVSNVVNSSEFERQQRRVFSETLPVNKRRGGMATRRHGDNTPSASIAASPRPPVPLITLLTDFGTSDYFVAAIKGLILAANPNACLIDITHEIPPQDIEAGAFTLLAAYSAFPAGTIHLAVVDPGVGSARRPILIKAREQFFVGPDNRSEE